MKVNKIELKGFRNINSMTIEPDSAVNIIYGENAQGKTNILEGIWLFSGLKSFRGAKDKELVGFGNNFAKMKLDFEAFSRNQKSEITIIKKRAATLNGVALPSPTALMGKFNTVIFSPSFMSVIKDGPSERRKFIDSAICQLKPNYAKILSEYNRLLQQRNSVLKDISYNAQLYDMLDIIDEKLSLSGQAVIEWRKQYLKELTPFITDIYGGLSSGREEISFNYLKKSDERNEKTLSEILKENRREDILNKITLAGPHRDDIEILLNGISARSFGSQGQQRSCALALKLGEAAVIEKSTGEKPVVLLDDVMSELDILRQDYILNHIKDRQVFITCCDPSAVLRLLGGKTFNIEKGEIV